MPSTEGGVFAGQPLLASVLARFMVQAIIVIIMTRSLAAFLHHVGQPRVIAEVIGGIILGPSVLGRIDGYLEAVFPKASLVPLGLVANIGLVLYLFLVGIELDPKAMVENTRKTFVIALCGIGLPFGMGFAIAPYLFDSLMKGDPAFDNVKLSSFTVFVCVAISITAFPVLARILNETNVLTTVVGNTALGAAALDDVAAWSLLALSIALIRASEPSVAAYIFLSVVAYAIGVLVLLRPLWWRVIEVVERSGSHAMEMTLMAATFVLVFFSAWVTEVLGVHAIFGAFLFGLAMPRGHRFTLHVSERIEDLVQIVFLPLYFTLSGLKTNVGALTSTKDLLVLLVVIVTACAAKFLGCTLGARLSGLNMRESATVGILMNTRGLVELIVLNMGLEAGVLSESLFTIMVVMAIATTIMTTPLVILVYPHKYRQYIDHTRGAEKVTRKPQDVDVMMVLTHVEEVPALSSMMHLLQPAHKGTLRITAAYLAESSIHTTDILRTYNRDQDNYIEDPSLQLLQLVGSMAGAVVESTVLVGNPRQFAEELTRRNGIYFMGDSYEKFLTNTINKATQMVVILTNPTASSHNIFSSGTSATQSKRNILVIVTGEENDHEVLCLARRFANTPQVQVSLVVIKEQGALDPRVQAALNAFTSSLTEPHRVTTTTMHLSSDTASQVVDLACASQYDFILIGHSTLDLSQPATHFYTPASHNTSTTPRKASHHSHSSSITTTPRKHKKQASTVLGALGVVLTSGGVQCSILVVHGAQSFMESSTSLSLRIYDNSADKRPDIHTVDWELKRDADEEEGFRSPVTVPAGHRVVAVEVEIPSRA